MSDDSSKLSKHSFAKRLRTVLTPKKEWGIVMSIVVGIVALLGPWFLLEPLFAQVLPLLPIGFNLKVSIVTVLIELLAIGVIAAALAAYNKKFADIGVNKPKLLHLANAFVAFFVYIAVSIVLHSIAQYLFSGTYNAEQPQELGYDGLSGIEIVAAFIPLVLLTPLAEELIFRGFMFKGIRRHTPFWVTAIAVSALFGVAHGQWNVGLDVFSMSLISCYLVEKTGSLWPSIFLHVIKNGLAFSLVYLYNVG